MFREPYINQYRNEGKLVMPRNRITTFVLEDQENVCSEDSKEDSEAMFIDPISNSGYIIQKVRPRNTIKSPVIFKVISDESNIVKIEFFIGVRFSFLDER